MLVDWTDGVARWLLMGVASLVLHAVVLGLIVSTSETDEGQNGEPPPAESGVSGAPPAESGMSSTLPVAPSEVVSSADRGHDVPTAPEPPRTPDTVVPAERGNLADIGAGFDESTRVRSAAASVKKAEPSKRAAPKLDRPKPEKPKPDKSEPRDEEASSSSGFSWYTVKPGESLTRIARDCGMTPLALAQLNGFKKPLSVRLRVGQRIKVKAK